MEKRRLKKSVLALVFSVLITAGIFFQTDCTTEASTGIVTISTSDELAAIASAPAGDYVLGADIDMTGVEWVPFEFAGTLDGAGFSIINLTITSTGTTTNITYDGNMITYDTYCAGLFSAIKGATISNLCIVNEYIEINTTNPCFIGSIAGYSENSSITNCLVSDTRLNLTADCPSFGIGGVAGFGSGVLTNSTISTTMIAIDTNIEQKDEQFMGGVIAAGYFDIDGCEISIDGYDSDHGYVHDGGLVGMYVLYPAGIEHTGYITNTTINGMITFFEDNVDRRAYCSAVCGEVMNWAYDIGGNVDNFVPNEVFDYSVNLKPCQCNSSEYAEAVTESTCESFGFTTYTCNTCGYSYKDKFTLRGHTPGEWTVIREADYNTTGIKQSVCLNCGQEFQEEIPVCTLPEEFKLDMSSLSMKKGESTKLNLSYFPDTLELRGIVWSSSDESVVTVDTNGNVKAVSDGTSTISCSISDKLSSECTVTVKASKSGKISIIIIGVVLILLVVFIFFMYVRYINKKRAKAAELARRRRNKRPIQH